MGFLSFISLYTPTLRDIWDDTFGTSEGSFDDCLNEVINGNSFSGFISDLKGGISEIFNTLGIILGFFLEVPPLAFLLSCGFAFAAVNILGHAIDVARTK